MDKVQKELGFWQNNLKETVGDAMNDDNITLLQKVIDKFIDEA